MCRLWYTVYHWSHTHSCVPCTALCGSSAVQLMAGKILLLLVLKIKNTKIYRKMLHDDNLSFKYYTTVKIYFHLNINIRPDFKSANMFFPSNFFFKNINSIFYRCAANQSHVIIFMSQVRRAMKNRSMC